MDAAQHTTVGQFANVRRIKAEALKLRRLEELERGWERRLS